MERLKALVEVVLKEVPALPEETMRLKHLSKKIKDLSPEETALFFDLLYKKGATHKPVRIILNLLVDPYGLKNELGKKKHNAIYRVSVKLGLTRISRLFTEAEPYKKGVFGYDREEEAAMEFITLGQRRALSKSSNKNTLDRLLSDPDPRVITNILNNPRITEREVVRIASKRPNSPEILKALALHRVWSKRYNVIKAVALNPYAYPRVSVVLVEFMHTLDLKTVAVDGSLHPQVRLSAMEIIREKTDAM